MDEVILVVNDDLFFGGRILSVLEKSGFRAITAGSAEESAEKATRNRPALIIVNLNSKRLGGIEAVRKLKAADSGARILGFLSHTLIPPVKEEVLAAGVDRIVANSAISMRLPTILDEMLTGQFTDSTDEDQE